MPERTTEATPKSDADVLRLQDSIEMMKRRHLWPMEILPVKRADGLAFLLSDPSNLPKLLLVPCVSVFMPNQSNVEKALLLCSWFTPDQLYADGWRVD